MTETIFNDLEQVLSGQLKYNEPMSRHTSWRVGGPAEVLVEPSGVVDIKTACEYARDKKIPLTVIGNGSNLLVSDYGIRGMVLKIGKGLSDIEIDNETIIAGAGAKLSRIAAAAGAAGVGGLEFMAGIPGTLGGAVVMNAGAYGKSISQVLKRVSLINQNGQVSCQEQENIIFDYRSSSLQESGLIVTEGVLEGYLRDEKQIKDDMKDMGEKRRSSQPLNYPNAGSVFRNPPGYSAGKLIEESGAKGLRVGDAQVSEKHANFIINLGSATAEDILQLIERVQCMVEKRFGIRLKKEIRVLGRFLR
jgi:UDP-N-acetylmuramate dehydrogenase